MPITSTFCSLSRRRAAFALTILVSFGLGISDSALADGERIAVFTKNATNPSYAAFRAGADAAAAVLHAATVQYVPASPDDPVEQAALVNRMLTTAPDAVLFDAADVRKMEDSVRKVNAAGIPIVQFINRMKHGTFVTFVGADDERAGYMTARYLFRAMHGKGRVVVIEGTPGSTTAPARLRGFRMALAEYPNLTLLASAPGDYQEASAYAATVKLLARYPHIDGVFSANDSMALGVVRAFAAAKRTALIVGINASVDAARAIAAGRMLASEDYNTFKIGCLATYAAVRHLRGQPVPARVMIPLRMVDATNYSAWLTPPASRSCPTWAQLTAAGE